MNKEQLLKMELHKILNHPNDCNCQIHRVFGGWIYLWTWDNDSTAVFVPEVANVECKQH